MPPPAAPVTKPTLWSLVKQTGPGIAIAATGVGAADLVSSTVAGSQFGTTLAWAIHHPASTILVAGVGFEPTTFGL